MAVANQGARQTLKHFTVALISLVPLRIDEVSGTVGICKIDILARSIGCADNLPEPLNS
jgi:hypothetical protein